MVRHHANAVGAALSVGGVLGLRNPPGYPGVHSWSWHGSCPSHCMCGWRSPEDCAVGMHQAGSLHLLSSDPIPHLPILTCAPDTRVSTQVTTALPAWRGQSSSVTGWERTRRLPFPLEMPHLKKKTPNPHLPLRAGDLEQTVILGSMGRKPRAVLPEESGLNPFPWASWG